MRCPEDPISRWSAAYEFAGHLDPDARIPDAKLLKGALDANVPTDPDEEPSRRVLTIRPPTRGALVFTKGRARFGKIEATFVPAFYGLSLNKPLPARLDLRLRMPSMSMQDAFDSIPAALWGKLAGTKMSGLISWDMDLEVPMYDASEMVWTAEPKIQDFELLEIDKEVDPRKLTERFRHTIYDERVNFERTIRIPEMRPIPGSWLMDQAQLDLEQLEEHWTRGGWFPAPYDYEGVMPFWN